MVACDIATAASRSHRRPGAVFRQRQISLIQTGDDLTEIDAIANINGALDDLPGHTKA